MNFVPEIRQNYFFQIFQFLGIFFISDLMVANANVRKNYSTLVPDKVNHNLFWNRYFFKVHLIELQENKRQQLKARAEASVNANDEEINW